MSWLDDPLVKALYDFVDQEYADYMAILKDEAAKQQVCGPHCDARLLHESGCWACDLFPVLKQARRDLHIAFSDQEPLPGQRPCPAEVLRSRETINRWGGNVAQSER